MIKGQLRARGIRDHAVLTAMAQTPRHLFVPGVAVEEAYGDYPLPTTDGQTISQPYMVALMTTLLGIRPGHRVLEIGTGSGYQSAVLACLGAVVVTIERHQRLAIRAQRVLAELGWTSRISVVQADGTRGWAPAAPYDRVIVTAGAPHVPDAYRHQLADPGRLVIPVGKRNEQRLITISRHGNKWYRREGIACRFVPLVGEHGWEPPLATTPSVPAEH